ncbi:MAG TPA: cell division protein FtsZ [Bacteroidales bacterium]|nr:cell division protein FtsZ [Bacteroidales bacterium]HON21365.1 cell division protein FtsZ [Bacteroidales bacterium]HOR81453.1 cell division protein FtsZ [Bacteroidales bacterium]HPJ90628.1 cell division protein FtsZ [Bacteroidales bacterium]
MIDIKIDEDSLEQITPIVDIEQQPSLSIIKVMGVGGGGGNAVKHMYNMGIKDVDFMICNTDKQALVNSPIPVKIQLGDSGLGAGADPEVARVAALESEETIKNALEGTKMLFVTAGMGGGTGTGASPIVAGIAKEMGILTVGIVTYPFKFEQQGKYEIADEGINELRQNVDALIVIKNESLKSFYPDLKLSEAFAKVDDVLLIAAKSIAELITVKGIINVDFKDVNAVLQNSGTAIIGSGSAQGEDRARQAVENAINSPLLDKNTIHGAEKILFFISYGQEAEPTIEELNIITEHLQNQTSSEKEKLIWGHGIDETLGEQIRVTVIATGLHADATDFNRKKFAAEQIVPMQSELKTDNEINPTITHSDNHIDNDSLRNLSSEEIDEYVSVPAYERKKQMQSGTQNFKNNETSSIKIGADGIVENPPFLTNAVD